MILVPYLCSNFLPDFVWSLSNDIILSVSLDGTAKLWDVAAGSCIRTIEDEQGGELLCCAFQPLNNNMFVVSFHIINSVKLGTFYRHKYTI
jgi:WD40 repeat protein